MTEPGLVVVGASLAGLHAVQSARKTSYTGPITLLGAEAHLPYNRPPLSKAFLAEGPAPAPTTFPAAASLTDLGVQVRLGCTATALDTAARHIVANDERIDYSSLIVATGSRPRTLPGDQLPGVHTLRTVEDAQAIRTALDTGARTVIIGAGFIGAEIAAAARRRELPVTMVEAAPLPLTRAVGPRMAAACAALHTRNGTDLRCDLTVTAMTGTDRIEHVQLSDGTILEADLVVVGIGAEPVVEWLTDSGLNLHDGVVCDATLRAADAVYAAGDITRWNHPLFGESMRLEHWTAAAEQGTLAARNALDPGNATPYQTVPYFWSDWYTDKIQMVGICAADDVEIVGNLEDHAWLALYRRDNRLVGALAVNQPGKIMKYRAKIAARTPFADALTFAAASGR